jgi:hypothetical protein
MKRIFICFILLIPALLSCEDELNLEPGQYAPKLVVDGWIDANEYPVVVLTRSAAYFSTIDSVILRSMVATRAKVSVSDGSRTEILTLKKNDQYYPPYIYQGTELRGEAGKTYQLTIETEGQTYTARTTIPPAVRFDSLWFALAPGKDSLGYVYGRFTDDATTENYYRVFTRRHKTDSKYVPVYLSAIGDQFFNGQTVTFSLLRGPETMSDTRDDMYFHLGDTVRVKFSAIDRAHFDFWRTLERELYVTGNPFASTGNQVYSNISGNALGNWGGYNSTVHQVIAR